MAKFVNLFILIFAVTFCWFLYQAINLETQEIPANDKINLKRSETPSPAEISNPSENNATTTEFQSASSNNWSPVDGKEAQGDENSTETANVENYTGSYEWHPNPDCFGQDCASSWLSVEQSGQSIIFGIEANRGAPGYHMGTVGPVKVNITGNVAVYKNDGYGNCDFTVEFFSDKAVITPKTKAADNGFDSSDCWSACGFGYGVCVGGEYAKKNNNIPDFVHFGPTNVGGPVIDMTKENE